jgi:hypothetical protein
VVSSHPVDRGENEMELSDWVLLGLVVWVVFWTIATFNALSRSHRSFIAAGNIIDDLKTRIADLEERR